MLISRIWKIIFHNLEQLCHFIVTVINLLFFILAHHHIVHPQVKEHRDHVIKIIEDYLKGTYDEINMTHFITLDVC